MNTDNLDSNCHQNKEHATNRPSSRLAASLSPARLLLRMENIHRLGKKDVPRQ